MDNVLRGISADGGPDRVDPGLRAANGCVFGDQ